MKQVGDLLSPNDPELIEKTLARLDEQDRWNDLFSTKLIHLLDTNDRLRAQMREATTQYQRANDQLRTAEKQLNDATESLRVAAERQRSTLAKCDRIDRLSQRRSGVAVYCSGLACLATTLAVDAVRHHVLWLIVSSLCILVGIVGLSHWSIARER